MGENYLAWGRIKIKHRCDAPLNKSNYYYQK